MSMPAELATTSASGVNGASHYADWASIIAGTLVALGISIILFTFGAAIGLSMVSPYEGEGVSKAFYFVALGLWSLWVVSSSFLAGGYLAGRLRRRIGDATAHEVEVRDGAHGLTVWALGIVVASLLLSVGISGLLGSTAQVAGGGAKSASSSTDTVGYTVDSLFRSATPGPTPINVAERQEVARILTLGTVRGELTPDNKSYISRLVAERTRLTPDEADRRVSEVIAQAKRTADAARKVGIVIAFLTAATLLVGGVAAMWGAALGGRHRDQGTDTGYLWSWR